MNYDALKLENQLCFPLYACAKEVVRKYTPFLDEIDLTYTQYIVMMVLWEQGETGVKALGRELYLDSGTLSPLLKKLQAKGLLERVRSEKDERQMNVVITEKGRELKERAADIPAKIGACIDLSGEEAVELYRILYKVLGKTQR